MLLRDIKHYIQHHQTVPESALLAHFQLDTDALAGMIEYLVAQGHVRRVSANACDTGSCGSCQQKEAAYYHWQDNALRPLFQPIKVVAS